MNNFYVNEGYNDGLSGKERRAALDFKISRNSESYQLYESGWWKGREVFLRERRYTQPVTITVTNLDGEQEVIEDAYVVHFDLDPEDNLTAYVAKDQRTFAAYAIEDFSETLEVSTWRELEPANPDTAPRWWRAFFNTNP